MKDRYGLSSIASVLKFFMFFQHRGNRACEILFIAVMLIVCCDVEHGLDIEFSPDVFTLY